MNVERILELCLISDMLPDRDVKICWGENSLSLDDAKDEPCLLDSDTLTLGAGRTKFYDAVANAVVARLLPVIETRIDAAVRRIRRASKAKTK
ncbi:MAG: hypothetical protein WC683_05870 [bacterium]